MKRFGLIARLRQKEKRLARDFGRKVAAPMPIAWRLHRKLYPRHLAIGGGRP